MRILILSLIVCFLSNISLANDKLKVTTSIKPIYFIAQTISDGVLEPEILVDDNQSPHSFTPKPSDIRKITNADVIFYVDDNLEFFMQKYLQNKNESSDAVRIIDFEGLRLINFEEHEEHGEHDEEEEEHHEHEHEHEHEHNHEAGSIDPHIWLNPQNALIIAENIAKILSQKDSKNASIYQKNYESFANEMEKFIERTKETLKKQQSKPYIVTHDAYGYFEEFYGLEGAGVVVEASSESINARNMSLISKEIKEQNIKCLFHENSSSNSAVKAIKLNNDINVYELDPLGYKINAGKNAYFALIDNITNNMNECLSK